jgi:hypothetical protein
VLVELDVPHEALFGRPSAAVAKASSKRRVVEDPSHGVGQPADVARFDEIGAPETPGNSTPFQREARCMRPT